MDGDTDKVYACALLNDFLKIAHPKSAGQGEYTCEVSGNDPPDIVVTLNGSERWAVEVTRVYQRVETSDKKKSGCVASREVSDPLFRFAGELREKAQAQRSLQHGYVLYLEGPEPKGSWKGWKKGAEREVLQFVGSCEGAQSGKNKHEFDGGAIFMHEHDTGRWSPMVGTGSVGVRIFDIELNIQAMLLNALKDKVDKLSKRQSEFDRFWLFLINCYPLADDLVMIERIVRDIVRATPSLSLYDGIFWLGMREPAPQPIALSERFDSRPSPSTRHIH